MDVFTTSLYAEADELERCAASLEVKLAAMVERASAGVTELVTNADILLHHHASLCNDVRYETRKLFRASTKLQTNDVEQADASEKMLVASARAACVLDADALDNLVRGSALDMPVLRAAFVMPVIHATAWTSFSQVLLDRPRFGFEMKVEYGVVEFSVIENLVGPVNDLRGMKFALFFDEARVDKGKFVVLSDFMLLPKSKQLQQLKYDWEGYDEGDEDADGQLVAEAMYGSDASFNDTVKVLRSGVVRRAAFNQPDVFRVEFYPTVDNRVSPTFCTASLLWPAGLQLCCSPVPSNSTHDVCAIVPAITNAMLHEAALTLGRAVTWNADHTTLHVGSCLQIACAFTRADVPGMDNKTIADFVRHAFSLTQEFNEFVTVDCNTMQFARVLQQVWQAGLLHRFCEYDFTEEHEVDEVDADGNVNVDLTNEQIMRVGLADLLTDFEACNRFNIMFYKTVVTNLDVLIPVLNPVSLPLRHCPPESPITAALLAQFLRSVLNA